MVQWRQKIFQNAEGKPMADKVYEVVEIQAGFWAINEGGVRMYLLEGADWALLLDTGFGGGDLRGVVERLTDKPVRVCLSHDHHDHISNCKQFSHFILHRETLAAARPLCPAGAVFDLVDEGDVIDLGSRQLTVLHTPGHTPGSIALWDRAGNFALTGDSVGDKPVFLFLDGADMEAYETSLLRLAALLEPGGILYACHGTMAVTPEHAERLVCCCEGTKRGTVPPSMHTMTSGDQHRVFRYKDVGILY